MPIVKDVFSGYKILRVPTDKPGAVQYTYQYIVHCSADHLSGTSLWRAICLKTKNEHVLQIENIM